MRLVEADRARVASAVPAAEAGTDAEVAVIAAAQSDAYHDAALHWAVIAMLLLVAVQAAVPGHFAGLLDLLPGGGWDRTWSVGDLLTLTLVLLVLVFLAVRLLLASLPARMAVTPRATKTRRVRRRAVMLFRSAVEARTAGRTGVLLYLSIAERQAEIVADGAVMAAVPHEEWGAAMVALTTELKAGRAGDGLVAAIARIGSVLAAHFPHTGTDPNELPDRLIEL